MVGNSQAGRENRDAFEGLRQRGEVAGISGWAAEACGRAFNVANFRQPRAEVAEEECILEQRGDGILPGFDFLHRA